MNSGGGRTTGMPTTALVGVGYWGPNLLRNLVAMAGIENVIAVDSSVERLARVCAVYPGLACVPSLDDALDRYDLDAVVVATPVSTHHALAMQALRAGCHVLVEKPLAASVAQGRELVEYADAAGLTLMVGHTFLFSPRVRRMEQAVAEGTLGRLQYAKSSRLNLGQYQRDVSVVWDLAPHDFSILFRVLGEFPESVQTAGRVVLGRQLDVAFMTMTFPSGAVAAVDVSWLSPSKVRNTVFVGDERMMVYDDLDAEAPVKIYDKGVVVTEPENFGEHQLTYRHGDVLAPYIEPREPLATEIAHFLACASGNAACESDGVFGLSVVEALEAAERSWRDGGRAVPVAGYAAALAATPTPVLE